ncbi:MAG TPA: type I DNA topoisomerase [Ktedonobacteraceae bacterium]|jgi:DNA topoisomerase-1|nr:type I DNA topoisomerase [Ktedonobacteraceae bacterium]
MAKKLVIVESPAKAKTIEKFLGRDFLVLASMGHIIDLPKKGLGVNTRKDFTPKYEVIEKKDKLIHELKAASERADEVFLAPDPDREGEFIAWSLKNILGLQNPHRAEFHEITKKAVQEAINKPREINEDLFNAQQARRVLDRLVGYKISPLLWRRIQSGTSAGRVQSVALRIICEREAEVRAFVPEEYWSITSLLSKQGQKERFEAQLFMRLKDSVENGDELPAESEEPALEEGGTKNGKNFKGRLKISSKEEADAILEELKDATYSVLKYEQREQRRQPPLPYTTSTLQQDASARLYFKPKRTMGLAQQLYEGIELGERGQQGLITYMRTDSTRISDEAQTSVKAYIRKAFGAQFAGSGRTGKAKAATQDAHEAIRPTDVTLTPDSVKSHLSADQYKLYNLIWRRFVASFMTAAIFDTVRIDIQAKQYLFRATGSKLRFPGFYTVWPHEEDERLLPDLQVDEVLNFHSIKPEQHFTQPPPRFTEASLIKQLEEEGIGRPSTYVPILSTIQDRGYVDQDQRRFVPTWLGETVNEMMNKHFPDIVDTRFTADMERKLDDVEEGRRSWTEFLHTFYGGFKTAMEKAEAEMDRVQKPMEEMDEQCPDCGRNLVIRSGRFGRFISCSGFPDCRYRRSFMLKTGALCPLCQGDLVERKTKQKKRIFYGCSHYPACNFAIWERPVPDLCPTCGGLMIVPRGEQVPVCYAEFIARQQNGEAAPLQSGAAKTTRKRAASAAGEDSDGSETSTSTATKRRRSKNAPENMPAIPETAAGVDGAEGKELASLTTATPRRRSTATRSTTAASKRSTTSRSTTAANKRSSTGRSATTAKRSTAAGKPSTSSRSVAAKSETGRVKAVAKPATEPRTKAKATSAEKKTPGAKTGLRAAK